MQTTWYKLAYMIQRVSSHTIYINPLEAGDTDNKVITCPYHTLLSVLRNMSSRVSSNSETFASELQVDQEGMFQAWWYV